MMRVIQLSNPQEELRQIMKGINVDPYGIRIMVPKAISYILRINDIACMSANILKQEMLSLGGDVAVARGALTGKLKKTDCLLIGNLAQFNRLSEKLDRQPFGLDNLARDIKLNLDNYQKDNFTLDLGRSKINLSKRPCIMGIVNLTPDSFSGDGLYQLSAISYQLSAIVDHIQQMIDDGADIIDIGGESSRPGAKAVPQKEELRRTIPVIKKIVKKINVPISIDTVKPEVARQALDCGATIVNDITGLKDRRMLRVAADYKAAVVLMHMKGNPRTMQKNPVYGSLIDEITRYLEMAIKRATDSGINRNKIIIDPGIGFGKTLEHNLEILKNLREFKVLGRPILVGTSRKSFIGKILKVDPQERIFGTVSSCVAAVKNGAQILRVHDVKEVKQALKLICAINKG